MDIYRKKSPINTHVTIINTQSKSEISSSSNIMRLECDDKEWRHKKYNEVSILYDNGYVYYHCEYVIGPFLLCMHLMHDFKKEITYINQFKLFHQYLNVSISKVILLMNESHIGGISKYEINVLITNKNNTINIKRKMELTITVKLNESLDEYSLCIHIIKAPSILHNKQFIINNIFNHYDVLKYLLCEILPYFPNEILTVVCNQFLSKYFWIFPTPFIHHSLRLNRNITDRLPFQYQLYYGYSCRDLLNLSENYTLNTLNTSQSMIENVKYVGYHNLSQSNLCNINGIGIEIEIDDEKVINSSKYPQLFNIFNKYHLNEPELSTILPFENPSILYEIKNLYEQIEAYCHDKTHLIRINAKLLIDRNVDSNDIAMLWINWKPIHNSSNNDYLISPRNHNIDDDDEWINKYKLKQNDNNLNEYSSITPTYRLAISFLIIDAEEYEENEDYIDAAMKYEQLIDIFNRFGITKEYNKYLHKMAQMYCHVDIEKSVKCYQELMELIKDDRDILYFDKQHFGEPIIAMDRIYRKNKLIVNQIFNNNKNKKNGIKKRKNKNKFKYKQKPRNNWNKYPKKIKSRNIYHRW